MLLQQITILLANITQIIAQGYNQLDIGVSTDQGNSFSRITGNSASFAQITSLPASTTFRMGGHLLKFVLNGGSEVSVSFDPALDNWTPTQVVGGSVLITYNDATDLGFTSGQLAYGTDAFITLSGGQKIYTYIDNSGIQNGLYKYQLSHNGANPVSPFSAFITPSPVSPFSSSLVVCTATFIGIDGSPVPTSAIFSLATPAPFYVPPAGSVPGYGITNNKPLLVQSDDQGFLQVLLYKGLTLRVGIEGTSLVREFIVPNTDFDLISALGTASDPFLIQAPDALLTRRSV